MDPYEFYVAKYGGTIEAPDFPRCWQRAMNIISDYTSGRYENTSEETMNQIMYCACELCDLVCSKEKIRKALYSVDTGSVAPGGQIKSLSSGSESITYESASTSVQLDAIESNISETALSWLRGLKDNDGAYLLYRGVGNRVGRYYNDF